mgnify:CR=1 FL=1
MDPFKKKTESQLLDEIFVKDTIKETLNKPKKEVKFTWEGLKNFVPFTVFAFTPVIVSVCATPSISVPLIVNVTEALLDELDILTVDFKFDDAVLDRAPSIVKFPALPRVSLSTKPSLSAVTEVNPLMINEVNAVPL